jgi:Fe-S cluster biogenesis protein NfuA
MDIALQNKIETALDNIRPYLLADGGNVKVVGLREDMILQLELTGACSTCPMSAMTLKAGVEEAVKREIPEILGVEAINVSVA